MSATGRSATQGFTLIEMLVVLAIAGLIAGVGFPRLQSAMARMEARTAAAAVAAALRGARAAARLDGVAARFAVAADGRGFAATGTGRVDLPASVSLGGDRALDFFADGTSSGGRVTLTSRGRSARFDVAPATGLFVAS